MCVCGGGGGHVCMCVCVLVCACLHVHACMLVQFPHMCLFILQCANVSDEYITSQHLHLQDFTYLKVNMLDSKEETLIDHHQNVPDEGIRGRFLCTRKLLYNSHTQPAIVIGSVSGHMRPTVRMNIHHCRMGCYRCKQSK